MPQNHKPGLQFRSSGETSNRRKASASSRGGGKNGARHTAKRRASAAPNSGHPAAHKLLRILYFVLIVLCAGILGGVLLMSWLTAEDSAASKPASAVQTAEVPYGENRTVLIAVDPDLPLSDFSAGEFTADGQTRTYTGTAYTAQFGVDVSAHQGQIDWQQAAAAGVQFAYIRAGYRGYDEGELHEDERFAENLAGAQAAGIETGVYFFSQALTEEEAAEEAAFLIDLLSGKEGVTLPVVFDWEEMTVDGSRTGSGAPSEVTQFARVFCDAMQQAGYETCIYFSRYMGYHVYDLGELNDCSFWFSGEGDYPDFYYKTSVWQYCYEGSVAGFSKNVDLNLRFVPKES